MQRRISDNDITNYVMNELEPRERLYVESMMLGCDRSREEAMSLMEVSRLLEEGLEGELMSPDLVLDAQRRSEIFEHSPTQVWESVWRISAAAVALAACVAFSVAAPVISKMAFRSELSKSPIARQLAIDDYSDVVDPAAFPIAMFDADEANQGGASDEFPTHVLLPTGAVNFGEMPMPYLGSDIN
jgi:anti-sigma factor RsiW